MTWSVLFGLGLWQLHFDSLLAAITPRAGLVFYLLSFLERRELHALKVIPVKEKLFLLRGLDEPEALSPNQFLDCTLRHSYAPFCTATSQRKCHQQIACNDMIHLQPRLGYGGEQ